MGMHDAPLEYHQPLSPSQIADLRLAASQMTGAKRRAFEAEMAVKYCRGNPLLAETVFGWGRRTIAVGLAERRTGLRCLGAQAACSGRKRWEEQPPEAADTADSQRGAGSLESPRLWRGAITLAQYDGRGAQSSGLSTAQSGQSHTTEKACRDRRHLCQY